MTSRPGAHKEGPTRVSDQSGTVAQEFLPGIRHELTDVVDRADRVAIERGDVRGVVAAEEEPSLPIEGGSRIDEITHLQPISLPVGFVTASRIIEPARSAWGNVESE